MEGHLASQHQQVDHKLNEKYNNNNSSNNEKETQTKNWEKEKESILPSMFLCLSLRLRRQAMFVFEVNIFCFGTITHNLVNWVKNDVPNS